MLTSYFGIIGSGLIYKLGFFSEPPCVFSFTYGPPIKKFPEFLFGVDKSPHCYAYSVICFGNNYDGSTSFI